jgi:tripartite-type tricarboxylate transporter receptor subunit TctC
MLMPHAPGKTMIRAVARLVVLALLLIPGLAAAQSGYPSHTVKFIVPFPPGGINDVLARIVGDKLQAKWGQPVVVENRTGANGNIGAELAAQAEPDGYTIFVSAPGPLAINRLLYPHLGYKTEDFVPITVIGSVPNLAIVRKDLPVNSLKELIDYVKQHDGKVIYGSQGVGATTHLTANMFMTMTGTHMVHVPYRGETLVLNDLLGGHVDLFFGNISAALALYRAGKVKVLAVADTARNDAMPDVPTTAEAGLPGLVAVGWFAMAGPRGLKPELRDKIAADANEAIALPDVQAKVRAVGVTPMGGSPARMAAFIKEETERWGAVIRENHIVME